MYCYRITKYDPKLRNKKGYYLIDDWTSMSDIGSKFNSRIFTIDEYMLIEDKYIEFIKKFISINKLRLLSTHILESHNSWEQIEEYELKFTGRCDKRFLGVFNSISDNVEMSLEKTLVLARMILREYLWTSIKCGKNMIRFGYDYYMYFISEYDCFDELSVCIPNSIYIERYNNWEAVTDNY